MSATIIDGRAIAAEIRADIAKRASAFKMAHGCAPALAVVLVGSDPASEIYVRNKKRASDEVGLNGVVIKLPESSTAEDVILVVDELAADPSVHGIIVQLPLPRGIDADEVMRHIPPAKDVDGLSAQNMGLLALGKPRLVPCTPQGIVRLIDSTGASIAGKRAVVIGRSDIVGKPVAMLLTLLDATVTLCHSKTRDIEKIAREADILISAVGKPGFVTGDMIKEGALVIDVGTTRVDGKLKGDVDFESAVNIAGYITPVPGGVGPMTIAMLLQNTCIAAEATI